MKINRDIISIVIISLLFGAFTGVQIAQSASINPSADPALITTPNLNVTDDLYTSTTNLTGRLVEGQWDVSINASQGLDANWVNVTNELKAKGDIELNTSIDSSYLQKSCSILIAQIGSYTYALNGTTGKILNGNCWDTSAANVINWAIGNTTRGGLIHLAESNYSITASIVDGGNNNITLEGEGWNTLLQAATGLNTNVIYLTNCSGWTIRDLMIDGDYASQTAGSCIKMESVTNFSISNLKLIEAKDFALSFDSGTTDGTISEVEMDNGGKDDDVDIDGAQRLTFIACTSRNHVGDRDLAISQCAFEVEDGAKDITFIRCIAIGVKANARSMIGFHVFHHVGESVCERISFIDCDATSWNVNGYEVGGRTVDELALELSLINCRARDCDSRGLVLHFTSESEVIGGHFDSNTLEGVQFNYAYNCKANGVVVKDNHRRGFTIENSERVTLTDVDAVENYNHGVWIDSSRRNKLVGCSAITNGKAVANTYDGFFISDYADDNELLGCFAIDPDSSNQRYGIRIDNARDDRTRVFHCFFYGNIMLPISDLGTDTILETLTATFVEGTAYNSTAGKAQGWQIDAGGEWATTAITLPESIQQIVRIKIYAVSMVVEAEEMNLELEAYGAASNETFTTETITIATWQSTTTNFSPLDIIYWTATASDDADIGHLLGGDSLQIKVLHEAAAAPDGQTEAIMRCVTIEYV